jgi:uncharacterized oligopeptide transporter (OPT) family protein
VIWRKLALLAGVTVAWVFLFFILFLFFVFGDCFDEQCRASQVWDYKAVIVFVLTTYLVAVWVVLRRRNPS